MTFYPYEIVLKLKERVQDKEGIPPDQQRWVLQGISLMIMKQCPIIIFKDSPLSI